MAEPLLRHEGRAEQPAAGDVEGVRRPCRGYGSVPASGCIASPDTASKNSPWPLPATPAMPMTSPARTFSEMLRQRRGETASPACGSGS